MEKREEFYIINTKNNFNSFLNAIKKCYSVDFQNNLPLVKDFPKNIFSKEKNIISNQLLDFAKSTKNNYLKSVSYRILGIGLIQNAREDDSKLDIFLTWKFISKSIMSVPKKSIISSIGSQGFLSIPLYKFDEKMSNFDFIRLHIWHNNLASLIDLDKSKKFSVHSHSFLAKSWILNGKILNNRYIVEENNKDYSHSLFMIKYNNTLNQVNQHTSSAVNTGKNVDVELHKSEIYTSGESYEVPTGEFHSSSSQGKEGLSSTFFSFTSTENIIPKSFVVGPSSVEKSKINRKMHINPEEFIKLIDINLNQK